MNRKECFISIGLGAIVSELFLWGGSWLMHIVPDYLGVAAFATMFSGVIAGVAILASGIVQLGGTK